MQPFLQGRSVIKSDNPASSVSSIGFKPLSSPPPDESIPDSSAEQGKDSPHIELHNREDGQLQRIVITCTCGKRIELECDY